MEFLIILILIAIFILVMPLYYKICEPVIKDISDILFGEKKAEKDENEKEEEINDKRVR